MTNKERVDAASAKTLSLGRAAKLTGGLPHVPDEVGCFRKATIPQSALARSQLPLHKGAFSLLK